MPPPMSWSTTSTRDTATTAEPHRGRRLHRRFHGVRRGRARRDVRHRLTTRAARPLGFRGDGCPRQRGEASRPAIIALARRRAPLPGAGDRHAPEEAAAAPWLHARSAARSRPCAPGGEVGEADDPVIGERADQMAADADLDAAVVQGRAARRALRVPLDVDGCPGHRRRVGGRQYRPGQGLLPLHARAVTSLRAVGPAETARTVRVDVDQLPVDPAPARHVEDPGAVTEEHGGDEDL